MFSEVLEYVEAVKTSPRVRPTISVIPENFVERLTVMTDNDMAKVQLQMRKHKRNFKGQRASNDSKTALWNLIKESTSDEDNFVYFLLFVCRYYKVAVPNVKKMFDILEIEDAVIYGS